jgi:hypothetical protein
MKAKPGMIGFSNNKIGWLPKLIRFFTNSHISHALVITEDVCGITSVQEASIIVQVVPLDKYYRNNPNCSYWIYSLTKATEEEKKEALKYCYNEYAGDKYGFLQLLWFIYRWFCVSILKQNEKEVVKRKNWLSDGVICSEFQYGYLTHVNEYYANLLKEFNPDTIQAEDLRKIVEANPDAFKLEEYKV